MAIEDQKFLSLATLAIKSFASTNPFTKDVHKTGGGIHEQSGCHNFQ